MHGNVLEWCQDSYHDSYSGAPIDGSPWLSGGGEQNFRIVRGGAWDNKATNVRSAMRTWTAADRRYYNHGFRVVAVPRTP